MVTINSIRALLQSQCDNVATVLKQTSLRELVNVMLAASGEYVGEITASNEIPFGHKIALKAIRRGEKVVRYGYAIGIATQDIPEGAHVHSHNLHSLVSLPSEIDADASASNRHGEPQ